MMKPLNTAASLMPVLLLAANCQAATALPSYNLDEVIVTATRIFTPQSQVSSSTEVITREDIQKKNAQTLGDIIESYAGVSVARESNRKSLSMRGVDAKYSLLLIDGMRMPSEPDKNYELDRIPLGNVERIEIVRGPSSALYGSDAMGGVVNIVTKVSPVRKVVVQTRQGMYWGDKKKREYYSLGLSSGKMGKVSFDVFGNTLHNSAVLKSDGTTYDPFGKRDYLAGNVLLQPTETDSLTFSASYLREDDREYSVFNSLMGPLKTNFRDDNKRTHYSVKYNKKLGGNDELNLEAYYNIWDKYNETQNRINGRYTNAVWGYYKTKGVDGYLSKTLSDKHKLVIGGEFRNELFKGTGIKTGQGAFSRVFHGVRYAGSETTTDYYAAYIQDVFTPGKKLSLTTGIRYDGSSDFSDSFSPKFGIVYNADDQWSFKANISTGFRVPSPNQLYLNLVVPRNGRMVSFVGNDNLKPEKSLMFDVSAERKYRKGKSKLTFFNSNFHDMINETYVATNKIQYENVAKARIYGIEASTEYAFSSKFSANLNYTYLNAENRDTDERLKNEARHKISAMLSYKPDENWGINLWADTYLDYRYQKSQTECYDKDYTMLNLNVNRKIGKNTTLTFGLDNLLDYKDDLLDYPGILWYVNCKFEF